MIKRVIFGIFIGNVLGLICILGATLRAYDSLEFWYLLSFWFNRFLMGFVISLMPMELILPKKLIRGFVVGLLVSFAFYSATNFVDLTGFIVGGFYGLIIELALHYLFIKRKNVQKDQ